MTKKEERGKETVIKGSGSVPLEELEQLIRPSVPVEKQEVTPAIVTPTAIEASSTNGETETKESVMKRALAAIQGMKDFQRRVEEAQGDPGKLIALVDEYKETAPKFAEAITGLRKARGILRSVADAPQFAPTYNIIVQALQVWEDPKTCPNVYALEQANLEQKSYEAKKERDTRQRWQIANEAVRQARGKEAAEMYKDTAPMEEALASGGEFVAKVSYPRETFNQETGKREKITDGQGNQVIDSTLVRVRADPNKKEGDLMALLVVRVQQSYRFNHTTGKIDSKPHFLERFMKTTMLVSAPDKGLTVVKAEMDQEKRRWFTTAFVNQYHGEKIKAAEAEQSRKELDQKIEARDAEMAKTTVKATELQSGVPGYIYGYHSHWRSRISTGFLGVGIEGLGNSKVAVRVVHSDTHNWHDLVGKEQDLANPDPRLRAFIGYLIGREVRTPHKEESSQEPQEKALEQSAEGSQTS